MYKGNRNQPKLRGRRVLVAENEKRHLAQQGDKSKQPAAPPSALTPLLRR
jgi:hypothetical protein